MNLWLPKSYKEPAFLVLSAVLVLIIPVLMGLYYYFREYDDRDINYDQPISIGEMIYSGRARISEQHHFERAAKMVTQQYSYTYNLAFRTF